MPLNIHIFNPETDYALAVGKSAYNPPAKIISFRREMAFFPAVYADDKDWILTFDNIHPSSEKGLRYMDMAKRRNLRTTTIKNVAKDLTGIPHSDIRIIPWGWNHSLVDTLVKAGIDRQSLKTDEEINMLRQLSHRRTCITFQKIIRQQLPHHKIPESREISSIEEASEFLRCHGDAYFKLPWSSSGRGVLHASSLPEDKLLLWIEGGIRRQGSIMAEQAFVRKLDFATEWNCKKGKADFLGLSVFHTSHNGRYIRNIITSQHELERMIFNASGKWDPEIIIAQKQAIETIIAPFYSGPAGIDMLVSSDGSIIPCVEINLRHTMGMAALFSMKRSDPDSSTK